VYFGSPNVDLTMREALMMGAGDRDPAYGPKRDDVGRSIDVGRSSVRVARRLPFSARRKLDR